MGILADELTGDPLERGYAAMSDAEAAADLNMKYRTRNRGAMSASEVLNAVDQTEYADPAFTAEKKAAFWGLLGIGELNPFGVEAQIMVQLFGGTSGTISALQQIRVESVTRGVELGLGHVKVGHVQEVRGV